MEGVPHLKELSSKFREKGFEIIAVSDEDESKIAGFVKSKATNYGIVKASKSAVYDAYGANGYPSAWVLDVEGKCLWAGRPASLTEGMVEEWTKDLPPTRISREVAKALKPAVEAFNKGEFGKAVNEVARHLSTDDAASLADAEYIDQILDKRQASGEAKAGKLKEAGDQPKLVALLEAEAKAFDGCEYGQKCADDAKNIKAGKEYKDCVKARDALDKLKPKVNDMKAEKAKKALEKIAKDFPNTPAGKEAAELAKDFN